MAVQDFKVKNGVVTAGDVEVGTSVVKATTPATAVSLFATSTGDVNLATSKTSGNITVGGVGSTVVVSNLTVNGTTTTINSEILAVDDKNIELGAVDVPTDVTADGGGITLKGSTDKTIIWDNPNDNWTSNQHWNLSTGLSYKINNVSFVNATTLGAASVTTITSGATVTALSAGTAIGVGASTGTLTLNNPTVVGSQPSVNLWNTASTTVAAFGAATAIGIGATTGTLTLNNPTIVGSQTSATLWNTVATTVAAFGAGTTIGVGATTGTLTLNNPTVVGSQTTVNLWNTTSTTVNAFGAGTTIGVGATTGTLTLNNPTVVGSQTSATLWNTVATTVAAFGAATTLTIGAATAAQNITIGGSSTGASTYNFGTGAVASATKTINLGTTIGASGVSNVNIGASTGTTTINSATTTISSATTTINSATAINLNSGTISTSAGNLSLFTTNAVLQLGYNGSATCNITLGSGNTQSGATADNYICNGQTQSGGTNTVRIAGAGAAGSTTNVYIGSALGTSTTTVNGTFKLGTTTLNAGAGSPTLTLPGNTGTIFGSGNDISWGTGASSRYINFGSNVGDYSIRVEAATSSSTNSGSVFINAGSCNWNDINAFAGSVNINGGSANGATYSRPGSVNLSGGTQNTATGTGFWGGDINIAGGNSSSSITEANAGHVRIYGGRCNTANAITKVGGSVYIDGGSAQAGGSVTLGSVYLGTQASDATIGTGAVYIGRVGIITTINGTTQMTSGSAKVGQTTLTQGGAVSIVFPTNAGTLIGNGDTNTLSNAVFRQSAGLSVVGRSANSTGNVADIVGTDGQVLRVSGTTLGFGTVANAGLTNSSVTIGSTSVSLGATVTTFAGLTSVTSTTFVGALSGTASTATSLIGGNSTTLIGSIPYQSDTNVTTMLGPNTTTTRQFLRQTGTGINGAAPAWDTVTATDVGLGNVTNESKATMFTNASFTGTFTVPNSSISYAEIQDVSAQYRILGRISAAAGVTEELTPDNIITTINQGTTAINAARLTLPSGQTAGSATSGYLQYAGTTKTIGQLDGGAVAPTNVTRLNYDGYLYATKFYGILDGTLATPRSIYGNNFDGSAALGQVIASTYGGTGNGFTKFSGPTTAEKTFTLPDSSATLLYSGGALGTPASGNLANCTFPTLNQNTTGSAGSANALNTANSYTVAGFTVASAAPRLYLNDTDGTTMSIYNNASTFYVLNNAGSSLFSIDINGNHGITGTTIYGTVGSSATYGSVTIKGVKNSWSGINFKDSSDVNCITLMTRSSDGYHGVYNKTDNGWMWYVDGSSNFVATGNVTAYSDERLKTNWRPVTNNFVEKLSLTKSGVYDRTDDENLTQVGVSAQSLQEILPEAVLTGEDGMLSVAYGNAALAACVELAKEVVALRKRIEELEAK